MELISFYWTGAVVKLGIYQVNLFIYGKTRGICSNTGRNILPPMLIWNITFVVIIFHISLNKFRSAVFRPS